MVPVESHTSAGKSDPRTAGYQRWSKLTFLHWKVDASTLQCLLPDCLQVQQFDGSAWLGVVPFSMERIRPWWSPPVPGISWFLETNVRTYVVDERGTAGVWFFTLDCNSRIAVKLARTFWHLPYKSAFLSLELQRSPTLDSPTRILYAGVRKESPVAEYELSLSLPSNAGTHAQPHTLEHFLVERYLLFATDHKGRLRTGRVHHAPYQLVTPASIAGAQSLTSAIAGQELSISAADHVAFCAGVDVRVSPLRVQDSKRWQS